MRYRACLCALILAFPLFAQDRPSQDPTIEEMEKQLAELQAKLAELKKQQAAQSAQKKLNFSDADTWRSIRGAVLSNDGKWFAHRVGPNEGNGEVVLRQIAEGRETRFPGGGGFGILGFSFDSKWLLFSVNPVTPKTAPPTAPRPRPSIVLVNLVTGVKTELEGFSSAQFNGEAATHLALRKASEAPSGPSLPPGVPSLPGGPPPTGAAPPTTSSQPNTDLILHELATGTQLLLGNVAEYAFNKKGDRLVMVIDAAGQIGNGVQLRDMTTGGIFPLDTAKASYRGLTWHEDFDAFTLVKAIDDPDFEGKWNTILGVTDLSSQPKKHTYNPKGDPNFPNDMGISTNRPVQWTKGRDAFLFGIAEQKRKDASKKEIAPGPRSASEASSSSGPRRSPGGGPGQGSSPPAPTAATAAGPSGSAGRPDLVVWHWKDERLQPMQQVQANTDKQFTYTCIYHLADKKFVRLADESCRQVTLAPQHRFAIGQDTKPYDYLANLNGQRYSDIYTIDTRSGQKTKALTKVRYYFGPSPTGTHFLYYDDGHFYTYNMTNGAKTNITAAITTTQFIDTDDDHNVVKPPTRPLGWSKDGQHVLMSDGWDLWKVNADGSGGVKLTLNGKKDGLRYQGFSQYEPDRREPGFDFSKPGFTGIYGEWTKQEGIGRIEPDRPGVAVLAMFDAKLGPLQKARDADVYAFTRETTIDPPNYYVATGAIADAKRITDSNPQQKDYAWSSGAKLVEYSSGDGKRLQAALFLPANYQPGKKYPTIVYIYEKLSQGLHSYTPPLLSGSGFNKSVYLSHGYAVLMPDIVYQLNDPGKSSIECINAAIDAAIATGIVDGDKLGLQGHSWGGYQTAFAITQTNRFRAACAGAPLTDLVSMYSSIYWNTGSANQPIFESSQGRFTAGYWDLQEAYIRNSPIYFAKNVQTPLLMMHNDKDGAVDFTQGIEYYNTLRRLQKPVVMLQYKGENHGLAKTENRKDYANRMKEFFDHYLQGAPAPDWWTDGVPHLKIEEHLRNRK